MDADDDDVEKLKERLAKLVNNKKRAQKSTRIRCIYLSKEGERQLSALAEAWGENPSTIVRHCLDMAYNKVFGGKLSL